MTVVTLYAKPGCCLCEQARATLDEVRRSRGFELHEVDISTDPVLNRVYGERIPVVSIDGVDAFEAHVERDELAARLDRVQA